MAMNGKTLDYKDIFQENRGAMHGGRLQLLNEKVLFKNNKTGKIDTMTHDDLVQAFWRRVARNYQLKLVSKTGAVLRFDNFREQDFTNLKDFLQDRYDVELESQELSSKGWNWGKANFSGDVMSFDVSNKTAFEIPLINVSQCTASKDSGREVALEFHQNEDPDQVSLMEMRFYMPPSQDETVDRVQEFHENVMAKADVLLVKGNAICTFQGMKFLTPRGHYDVRMYPKFIQLHGKTYDYKITYTSILRLFLLPNRDERQMFFVISMDPPLKQGQTRYHFLIMLFLKETELSVDLLLDEDLKKQLGSSLKSLDRSGPAHEVVSDTIRFFSSRRITVPGDFQGVKGSKSITCSYKAYSGFLFPLPKGFMFVVKPPIHIRFEEISYVNFARGTTSMNKSFDFEIETKNNVIHNFSNIEKGQWNGLYDFVAQKKLKIKNVGKDGGGYDDRNENMEGSDESGDEGKQHDPYLYRMKQEAANRNGEDVGEGSDESTDEDFAPGENEEDIKEEFDSNASESGGSGDEPTPKKVEKKEKPKKKKPAEPRATNAGGKRKKAKKDPNAPKRPMSAYFLWLNENRPAFKKENPGINVAQLSQLAGQKWKLVTNEEKAKYEALRLKSKEAYQIKLEEYNKNKPKQTSESPPPAKSRPSKPKKSSVKSNQSSARANQSSTSQMSSTGTGSNYKSKEFIQSSDSSSDDEAKRKKTSKSSKSEKKKPEPVKVADEEDMETEEEAEITDSDSD